MPRESDNEIQVTLPDGSSRPFPVGTTVGQVAESIGPGLARAALAGKVDGQAVDLGHPLENSASVELLTFSSDEGKEVYWHSTAHIMAQAVQDLYPGTKVTIGPPIGSVRGTKYRSPRMRENISSSQEPCCRSRIISSGLGFLDLSRRTKWCRWLSVQPMTIWITSCSSPSVMSDGTATRRQIGGLALSTQFEIQHAQFVLSSHIA